MARRRFRKAGFNQKLIMDVGLAGIAVRIVPLLLNKFVPLDPTLYTVAGAGGGYLVGSMLKKPDLANASIALGLVEFIAPMVENLIGGIGGATMLPPTISPSGLPVRNPKSDKKGVRDFSDYLSLNDYISEPSERQSVDDYRSSY
jgi:hypothetical protein